MSIFNANNTQQFLNELNQAKNIVITAHKSPDGDSVGSTLGLYHFLKELGYETAMCHPDPAPDFLTWLPEADKIISWQQENERAKAMIAEADLLICLDFNAPSRVGKDMEPALIESTARKVMIDHHLQPDEDFFDVLFSDTSCCSTSQLIAELIIALKEEQRLNADIGTPLYCGIMTDTGSFRFPSTAPETHDILGMLLRSGVRHWEVHENVYDSNTIDRIKLRGYALSEKMEIWEELETAVISLSEEEMKRYNYRKGDTEGLVNVALSIVGMKRAAYFSESEGYVKISFRSKGEDNPVNEIASKYFEGGGHKNAAGGRHDLPLETAIERFKKALEDERA
jgi:phosphoesterase RecJ-like protein